MIAIMLGFVVMTTVIMLVPERAEEVYGGLNELMGDLK